MTTTPAECLAQAQAIAAALGDWTAQQSTAGYYLIGPAGMVISIRPGTGRLHDRICFSSTYRHDKPYEGLVFQYLRKGEKLPHITVAADSTPKNVAKHLRRRLIPKLSKVAGAIAERIDAELEWNAKNQAIINELADMLGTAPNDSRGGSFSASWFRTNGYGNVRVHGDTATIELRSLPLDLARKVLAPVSGKADA